MEIGELLHGVESDLYLMGLTSPGLETPPQSSIMSRGSTELLILHHQDLDEPQGDPHLP
jgi:hypothetical protein